MSCLAFSFPFERVREENHEGWEVSCFEGVVDGGASRFGGKDVGDSDAGSGCDCDGSGSGGCAELEDVVDVFEI